LIISLSEFLHADSVWIKFEFGSGWLNFDWIIIPLGDLCEHNRNTFRMCVFFVFFILCNYCTIHFVVIVVLGLFHVSRYGQFKHSNTSWNGGINSKKHPSSHIFEFIFFYVGTCSYFCNSGSFTHPPNHPPTYPPKYSYCAKLLEYNLLLANLV
jgi:hypothetical protein